MILKKFIKSTNSSIGQRFINFSISSLELLSIEENIRNYNWRPSSLTEANETAFFSRLTDLSEKVREIQELTPRFHSTNDQAERAEILNQHQELENEIQNSIRSLDQICPNFSVDFQKFSETLSSSVRLGINLLNISAFTLPDGNRLILEQLRHEPIYLNNTNNIERYEVKLVLREENEADSFECSLNEFKTIIERNSLSPEINNLEELNSSIFVQNSNLEEGQSFFSQELSPPTGFKVLSITNDKIIIDKALNPHKEGDLQKNELSYGEFISLLSNHKFKPLSEETIQDVEDLSSQIKEEISSQVPDFKSYDEVVAPIEKEDVPIARSFLKDLKENTMFYSVKDLVDFFKHIWANYKGRSEVLSKYRVGKLGEEIFSGDLKEHFKQGRRKEAERAIMESTEKLLKSKTPAKLINVLRTSSNKYHLEVAFNLLAEKGFLNMWDPYIWKNMFRNANIEAVVPKYTEIDPNSAESKLLYDKFGEAVNKYWDDPNQFSEWERKSLSSYSSKVSTVMDRANRVISSVGFAPHMEGMLKSHIDSSKKDPVDPHEYEAMLVTAMENGKGSIEEKIYYLIQGITLRDKNGDTIMSMDRVTQMAKQLHSKFLPLTFFVQALPRTPNGKPHPITRKEFESFQQSFQVLGKNELKPNRAVRDFLWNTVITNSTYKTLAADQVRNLSNLEADDAQYFIPLASESVIKTSCTTYGGLKMSMDGFANGFAGYSQYIKTLANIAENARFKARVSKNVDERQNYTTKYKETINSLKEAIKAYVIFEAIMTSKYDERGVNLVRMDRDSRENKKVANTKHNANHFITELNQMILSISNKYNNPSFKQNINPLYSNQANIRVENTTKACKYFSDNFDDLISQDPNKLVETILESNLTGISE